LASCDIFANIVGGVRIEEPAADLAVALAVVSAERGVPLPEGAAVYGELGLTGELRSSGQPERRVAEAKKIGFTTVYMPNGDLQRIRGGAGGAVGLRNVRDAAERLLKTRGKASRSQREPEQGGGG
jgi:DNA repair protein RadA/Sms